jgi:hypothetical protein
MPNDFDVQEKKGVKSITWNGIDLLIIPGTDISASRSAVNASMGRGGAEAGGTKKKHMAGEQ